MATTNATGPDFSTPGTSEGQVRGDGRHKLASNSSYLGYFSITNGGDSVAGSNTGALKLEWYPEDKLFGGSWDVYLAGSSVGPWYKVGTITYGSKAGTTAPTFNVVTSAKAGSSTLMRQQETITVNNTDLSNVDGGASILIKFVPLSNRGLVLTACELTYTS